MAIRGGLRTWLGIKIMSLLLAVQVIYLASSHLKGLNFVDFGPDSLRRGGFAIGDNFRGLTPEMIEALRQGRELDEIVPKKQLKWAIITPPKPFSKAQHQFAALHSWLALRTPPKVFLVEASDLDPKELDELRQRYGVETLRCRTNKDGLLLQNSIFELASEMQNFDVVVVVNSDIILMDDFLDALEHVEASFERFLMIGARFDGLEQEEIPVDAGPAWLAGYRERALKTGALHTYGGTDYYAWRPVGDPTMSAIGGRIPPFTYGRGKADNWIVDMAVSNGVVQVVDASTGILALHPAHGYHNVKAGPAGAAPGSSVSAAPPAAGAAAIASGQPLAPAAVTSAEAAMGMGMGMAPGAAGAAAPAAAGHMGPGRRNLAAGKYVNFWSAHSAGDVYADFNKYLAYTFGTYVNMEGTPLHAPWNLGRCWDGVSSVEYPCLRRRIRPAACPCEHNVFTPNTLTEVETDGKVKICGKLSKIVTESFPEDFAFATLMSQQAEDGTIILIGFNFGYQDMLLNMVCRLQQLNVSNYVIAAFDAEAFAFCRSNVLPCFQVLPPEDDPTRIGAVGEAQAFGTKGFRALTKLKSQQVLRILRLGYHVMWSDVDIFWKINVLPGLWEEVNGNGVHVAIQSNAPPAEEVENGHRRINSGFYLVRNTPESVEAFSQIVTHARGSKLSEQPSFYSILCGDKKEYVTDPRTCHNGIINVKTRFLDRRVYPNGAMKDVLRELTPISQDNVAIAHWNWREGHNNKVMSFVNASMWMLSPEGKCMYGSKVGVASISADAVPTNQPEGGDRIRARRRLEVDDARSQQQPEVKVEEEPASTRFHFQQQHMRRQAARF